MTDASRAHSVTLRAFSASCVNNSGHVLHSTYFHDVNNTGHLVHTLMVSNALQAHRDGCMCIICKQARRVGKTWGGMSGMPGGPKWQGPMIPGGGRQGQPVPRFGKRAFLHALPHLVCGPLQHKVAYLPFAPYLAAFCHADSTVLKSCSVACPNMSVLQRACLISAYL